MSQGLVATYIIAQQAAMFHSVKLMFANKPLIVVCNKIDLQPLEAFPGEYANLKA
jgi:nucleolar GTP-binding protein